LQKRSCGNALGPAEEYENPPPFGLGVIRVGFASQSTCSSRGEDVEIAVTVDFGDLQRMAGIIRGRARWPTQLAVREGSSFFDTM